MMCVSKRGRSSTFKMPNLPQTGLTLNKFQPPLSTLKKPLREARVGEKKMFHFSHTIIQLSVNKSACTYRHKNACSEIDTQTTTI